MKDKGPWHAAVHWITKSQTQFSNWTTTTNKHLLYSTGNSTQCSVMTYMGKESKDEWIYVYVKQNHYAVLLKLIEHYKPTQISSVQFSHSVVSDSLRPHESYSCPSSRGCHPAISSSVIPLSSCPQSLQHQGLFQWINPLHEVAKLLEFQLQHQPFQWTPRTDLL